MSSENAAEPIQGNDQFRTLDRHADEQHKQDKRSDVIEAVPPLYMRGAIYIFIAVLIVALILTYIAKVFVIVPVEGKIIPEGQNFVVEAESPGTVTGVLVSPGDDVEAGDILVELRQDSADVDLRSLRDKLEIQLAEREKTVNAINEINRVLARPSLAIEEPLDSFQSAGTAMTNIAALRTAIQGLNQAMETREVDTDRQQAVTESQIALQNSTIARLRQNVSAVRSSINTQQETLARRQEELERTIELAERRVVPETEVGAARDRVLAEENVINERRQQLGQLQLQISQAQVEIGNLNAQLAKLETGLKTKVSDAQLTYDKALADLSSSIVAFRQSLQKTDAEVAEAQGKLRLQESQIQKLTIKSPVSGSITELSFSSAGQSVAAGDKVAIIVPRDVRPIVYATVPNKDIADVKVGIGARVKVDAYPFRQYGTVPAEVIRVFPLADKPEFAVRLQLDRSFISIEGQERPLEPGLTVKVDLLTKRKRILQLIFKELG